ncbi:hypothetical protein DEO72_LG7g1825 [Vigna unguiculata]|uniref:Uncharacterized protein n=1 Tax=Vigna unguiculata TaxID=3917 RepID=A0A4D6ML82_VIGUN|nr:hypothetical protein DEO72_LG7g1825 [Vigna unguiculata]
MEQQPFFSLPFSNAIVPDRKGSFFHVVAVSSLHRRSAVERASSVTQASSIVVIAEVAKPPPLSSFNLACRYDSEKRVFYVAGEMNEGVVKMFRRDAVVEDGGHDTLAAFRV